MFRKPRLPALVVCFSASAAVAWLAACASNSDAPSSARPSAGAPGVGAAGAATAGAPAAGATNGAAGAAVAGAGGALNTGGAPTTGGAAGAGTAGAATAGAGTAGAGTAGAGTGGGAAQSPDGFFVGGYLTRAPWMGYVFTIVDALGSTVSPLCDTTGCTPAWGTQACAMGSVAKDASSGSFAGLAFHANDPVGGPRGTWTSTGAGIYVSVSTPPTLARLQLQEEVASDDTRYCAPLPAGGTGLIPFSDFKTFCWGDTAHPSKVFAIGTKIHEVTITIPGNSTAAVPFNFCLIDIQPR